MLQVALRNNTLYGDLDAVAHSRVASLDVSLNLFAYPPTCRMLERAQCSGSLEAACKGGRDCIGLPPQSCLAYGADYVVRSDDPTKCVRCINKLHAILMLVGMGAAFAIMAISYAVMMLRYPSALKRYSATLIPLPHTRSHAFLYMLT